MNITVILGSIRDERKSDRIASYLLQRLEGMPGIRPRLLDLAEYQLPVFENRWAQSDSPDPSLVAFGEALTEADGLILISPEYHGSYTGVLKNAFDHFWAEFKRKPMGVVTTGSGKFGGINASSEMQQLVLSVGGYPTPTKLIIPYIQHSLSETGEPLESFVEKDTTKFLAEFLWFASAIHAAKRQKPVS